MSEGTTLRQQRASELADLIEGRESIPGSEFSMTNYVNFGGRETQPGPKDEFHCGTPQCMAGWAQWVAEGRPMDAGRPVVRVRTPTESYFDAMRQISTGAAEWLDPMGTAGPEVDGELFRGEYGFDENVGIAPDHAAATLRHWGRTGDVDWEFYPRDQALVALERHPELLDGYLSPRQFAILLVRDGFVSVVSGKRVPEDVVTGVSEARRIYLAKREETT